MDRGHKRMHLDGVFGLLSFLLLQKMAWKRALLQSFLVFQILLGSNAIHGLNASILWCEYVFNSPVIEYFLPGWPRI